LKLPADLPGTPLQPRGDARAQIDDHRPKDFGYRTRLTDSLISPPTRSMANGPTLRRTDLRPVWFPAGGRASCERKARRREAPKVRRTRRRAPGADL